VAIGPSIARTAIARNKVGAAVETADVATVVALATAAGIDCIHSSLFVCLRKHKPIFCLPALLANSLAQGDAYCL
jgi:hypothetical protein